MTYRVLLTVSRGWKDRATMKIALSAMVIAARASGKRLVLVHGDCPDGDRLAHKIARELGVPEEDIERVPAKWEEHGKQAGMIRNKEMVDRGADVCLAFVLRCARTDHAGLKAHGSHGATQCIKLAEHARIPVRGFGFGFGGVSQLT